MKNKVNFCADVSVKLREYLQKEYDEYIAKTSMADEERIALTDWVSKGNSPYGNPSLYADEKGVEMDFISGMRTAEELQPEV